MFSPKKISIAALSLLSFSVFTSTVMAKNAEPTTLDSVVQQAATEVMKAHDINGLAIAVSHNGNVQFYSFGVASKATPTEVTPDTLFEVGSISKLFTATLAAYAQANGQLSLNDPVDKYLPELQGSPIGRVPLMHLATHTAGGFPLQVPENVQNTQQLMDYLKAWKPSYPSGTQRSYANPSIGLLGMITAKSMNQPFVSAMENTLFPALGLSSSYLLVPANKMSLYAQGYNNANLPVRLNPGVLADEAYGVKTSARDLIHFAELNIDLGQPESLAQRAITQTHTGYFQIGPMTQDLIWEQYPYPVTLKNLLTGNSNNMAYENNDAIALNPPLAPQAAVWMNKTGSTSGFGGYIAVIPVKKQAVVILANKNYPNSDRIELAYKIFNAMN